MAGQFLTVQEAADLMRVHPDTIYRLLLEHRIPGSGKLGGQWRIHRQSFLDEFSDQKLSDTYPHVQKGSD